MQLAAVRREPGADRSRNGHVAVRIPIRTADEGDAKEADWNEESSVTTKPDEPPIFVDRPEPVVDIHDRKGRLNLLEAARAAPQRYRIADRFAGTKLEGVAALQRQTDLRLRQIRSEFLGVRIDMLEARIDVLDARIVEPNVGIDALRVWIHSVKISVGILRPRESRRDLDWPVDMHLRSGAWREHAWRDMLDWGSALDWSGALDDRSVWLRRLRTGDIRDAGHRRHCHESRSARCR